jgi:hypothetical protein
MNVIVVTYGAMVTLWALLFGLMYVKPQLLPRGRRSLVVLFVASLVSLGAWIVNEILVSLLASVLALVGMSMHGQVLGRWFKERFNGWALLVWLMWFAALALVLAHGFYLFRLSFV